MAMFLEWKLHIPAIVKPLDFSLSEAVKAQDEVGLGECSYLREIAR